MSVNTNGFAIYLPTTHQQVFAVVCSVLLLIFIFVLVRRRTIREEYSLLWILCGGAILAISISKKLMLVLIKVSGAGLASSILLLAAIIFIMLMLIHLTAVISEQRQTIKRLSIQVAILNHRVASTRAVTPEASAETQSSSREDG